MLGLTTTISSPWSHTDIVSKPDEHPRIDAVGAQISFGYIFPPLYTDRAVIPIVEWELVQYSLHRHAVPP